MKKTIFLLVIIQTICLMITLSACRETSPDTVPTQSPDPTHSVTPGIIATVAPDPTIVQWNTPGAVQFEPNVVLVTLKAPCTEPFEDLFPEINIESVQPLEDSGKSFKVILSPDFGVLVATEIFNESSYVEQATPNYYLYPN